MCKVTTCCYVELVLRVKIQLLTVCSGSIVHPDTPLLGSDFSEMSQLLSVVRRLDHMFPILPSVSRFPKPVVSNGFPQLPSGNN